jgi:HEAT repeat protein
VAGKQAYDRKLEALAELRKTSPQSPELAPALQKALKDRSNLIVAKAAAVVGELELKALLPDMSAAFARLLDEPAKADAQCWGKNALAQALKDLGHDDAELFLRGMRHVQLEPVWGGSADTAAKLRSLCAFGLLHCRTLSDVTVLGHLVDLLGADADPGCRSDAARAIASVGRAEGALLLKLKVLCGDEQPAVTGSCLAALLQLNPSEGAMIARQLLAHTNEDLRYEAAGALGESRDPQAFEALRDCYQRTRDPRFRHALLLAIGASLQPAGIEYLTGLIQPPDLDTAAWAIEALAPARFRDEARQQVEAAVSRTGSDKLAAKFQRHFGG